MIILAPIRFLGRHAPLVLPFGIILALLIPETTRDLNQFVPWLIVIIYSMTMIRINILQIFVQAIQPRYMMRNLAISLFILVFSPVLIFTLCRVIGVDEVLIPSALWYALAPPIASTAWMCALLGFNMAVAIQVIIMTSFIAPFTGPFIADLFLRDLASISSFEIFIKLALMIFGGSALALAGRAMISEQRINRNLDVFSGIFVLGMLAFLIPVFNGMGPKIISDWTLALRITVLVFTLNFGTQIVLILFARFSSKPTTVDIFSLLSLITSNRNVGLYYGALPPDPIFSLFTALYQIPLYLTPLFLGWLKKAARLRSCTKE